MRRVVDEIDSADRIDLERRSLFGSLFGSSFAIAAMAPALATAGSAANGEMPADLAKAVNDYDRATTRNDTAELDRLVADDYMLVNSDSSLQDKESYLDDFRLPGFRLDPYVLQQPVYKVWDSTALTGGLLPLSWTQDGERQSRLLRVVHVWTRPAGQWRLTYTQLTRVPQ